MRYMAIEHYRALNARAVYERVQEKGWMLPDGLKLIEGWVDTNFAMGFQLMECEDRQLFEKWMLEWKDLIRFEIIQVMTSEEAREAITKPGKVASSEKVDVPRTSSQGL